MAGRWKIRPDGVFVSDQHDSEEDRQGLEAAIHLKSAYAISSPVDLLM